jgi:hypothetical protein
VPPITTIFMIASLSCEPVDTQTYASLIESTPTSVGMLRLLPRSATVSRLFRSVRVMQPKQKVIFKLLPYFSVVRRNKHHEIEWFFATTLGRNLNTTFGGNQSP